MNSQRRKGKLPLWLTLSLGTSFWLLPTVLLRPALSAERISITYGIFQRSVSINSLENYAKTGKIDDDLAVYTSYTSPEQLAQVRRVLLAQIPLDQVQVAQFLYTPIGEQLLDRLGDLIQTDARQSGFYAIRAALILAAAESGGLTPLNVLRKFPSREIQINLARGLEIASIFDTLVTQTNRAVTLVNRQSDQAALENPFAAQLAPIWQAGSLSWDKQTITLNDRSRDRTFPVDLYLPRAAGTRSVIVISHGLGSDRISFGYLAEHLASYGFAVAVPEHPGSNAEQLQALLQGRSAEVTSPREFLDRPLDITALLNTLTRLSQTEPALQNRLNLKQVGVIGQSFGGYTALALAGAPIRTQHLLQACRNQEESLNLSLLLQCLGLELPQQNYNLADPRIQAAIAINPVSSSILGQASLSEIRIPTMIVSSSVDTVAPALPEQIQPFTWLTTSEKYLVLINNGTHFSTIAESPDSVLPIPPEVIGPNPAIARRYMQALSLAFFQTHLVNQANYRAYLTPAYTNAISAFPLKLSLLQSLTSTELEQAISRSKAPTVEQRSALTSTNP